MGKYLSENKPSLHTVRLTSALGTVFAAAVFYNAGNAVINGLANFLDVPIITSACSSALNTVLEGSMVPDVASYAFSLFKIALLAGVGYAAYRSSDLSSELYSSAVSNCYTDLKDLVSRDNILSLGGVEKLTLPKDVKNHFINALIPQNNFDKQSRNTLH